MYKNKFILAIKHNNKILRENKNIVNLPFDSEYEIFLKNENDKRAIVEIKIDSIDVLYGSNLIIEANSEISLERFIKNNNKGNKFKFVKLNNEGISDKENPENGCIEINCWLEKPIFNQLDEFKKLLEDSKKKEYIPVPYYYLPFVPLTNKEWPHPLVPQYPIITYCSGNVEFANTISCNNFKVSDNLNTFNMVSNNKTVLHTNEVGGTVQGSESDQKFTNVVIGEKDLTTFTQLRIWLRSTENPVYVEDTKNKFCTECGKKLQFKDKFCSQCGIKL